MNTLCCSALRRRVIIGALCLASAFSASSAKKPNVLFILTDQWRAQALGYAGDPNVKTPRLDKLAEEGINFDTTVSVCAICTPYRAALLTGRFPLSTGMYANDLYLPAEEITMGELFKAAGYNTAYIGKWHLDGHGRKSYIPPERRQGFDYWKVLECTHVYKQSQYYDNNDPKIKMWDGYDAYAQTKDAQAYIRKHATDDKPFLFFFSFGGPHFPHKSAPEDLKALYPPESLKLRPNVEFTEKYPEAKVREELQGYYGHCTAIDKCVGDLMDTLDELGIADNTIVVFTSDHGEMMGSHGKVPSAKLHPYDEANLVPFLFRYPPLTDGKARKIKTPLNTPDILPTLLALTDIEIPDTIEGEDLSVLIKEPGKEIGRAALTMQIKPQSTLRIPYRGVRTARYWYAEQADNGEKLLFDCEKDPYQMNNLYGNPEAKALQTKMAERLKEELVKVGDYPFKGAGHYKGYLDRKTGIPKDGPGTERKLSAKNLEKMKAKKNKKAKE
ncbi:Arylsulfatase [Pontiella desulfatans]|uniref:Arylsulfatase n=1 Tax=Pontiella desulfatans TaxID=2750659 RepID=A0A6C2U2F3_PONDE|nr:sulfatase [Pontiella desulfatans]SPS73833.1 sulfatase S1_27 [Kiritimatiellales bacterium]VGO13566.1 Arylsulfatase [Pontiella desulfatans]